MADQRHPEMDLQLNDELLSAYLDGEVTKEERLKIEAILAESKSWQTRYRRLVETVNHVRTLPKATLEKDLTPSIFAEIEARIKPSTSSAGGIGPSSAPVALDNPAVEARSVVAGSTTESQSVRLRRKSRQISPVWYGVAACLLIAVGIGWLTQFASTPDGANLVVVEDDVPAVQPGNKEPKVRVNSVVGNANNDSDTSQENHIKTGSRSPSVDSLANGNNADNQPGVDEMANLSNDDGPSPLKINIRVRRKPDAMSTDDGMPKESSSTGGMLARSAIQLDRVSEIDYDTSTLVEFKHDEGLQQIFDWLDQDEDGNLSDAEIGQAWVRFTSPDPSQADWQESVLAHFDHNDDQTVGQAELLQTAATLRWQKDASGQRASVLWYRLDIDRDGHWTMSELAQNAQFAGDKRNQVEDSLRSLHSLLDLSRNGSVSQFEFALLSNNALLQLRRWDQSILHPQAYQDTLKLIERFDRNNDRSLSGRELLRLKQDQPAMVEAISGDLTNKTLSAFELYLILEAHSR